MSTDSKFWLVVMLSEFIFIVVTKHGDDGTDFEGTAESVLMEK